jgi:hypothetical protein
MQEMYPFATLSPSRIPFIYQGLSVIGNQESHYWESQESSLLGKLLGKTTTITCFYSANRT